jgi:hypothetical protein
MLRNTQDAEDAERLDILRRAIGELPAKFHKAITDLHMQGDRAKREPREGRT